MKDLFFAACLLVGTAATSAPIIAPPPPIAAELQQYVRVPSGRIALTHVRVIDGTGAVPADDQTILIDGPRIAAVQPASAAVPSGYTTIDLSGASTTTCSISLGRTSTRQVIPKTLWWFRK